MHFTHLVLIVGVNHAVHFSYAGLIRRASLLHGILPSMCFYIVMVGTTALASQMCEVNQIGQVNPLGNEK